MPWNAFFLCLFKKRKMLLRFAFFLIVIILSFKIIYGFLVMPNIYPHQGDGRFENTSRKLDLFVIPGYSIKMPKFKLDKPKYTEYRLARLPSPPRVCYVYFAINTDDGNWQRRLRKNFRATLQLQLSDSSGRTLINSHGNLADYTAYSSSLFDFVALYPRGQNISFCPINNEEYIVHIAYNPDPMLKDYQGFVYFECGGSK